MRDCAFATFDIETAKILPASADLKDHFPLGITVAAVRFPSGEVRFWHGGTPAKPGPSLTKTEAEGLVRDLAALADDGTQLVTWNGAGFDFRVLAHESGLWEECARLARDHIDIMFHFFCAQGYPVALGAVGEPLGLEKAAGMDGSEAPAAWKRGEHDRVKEYLAGDVSMLAEIHVALRHDRGLSWITRRGYEKRWTAPRPLTVEEAMQLPEPDTSWMDDPMSRNELIGWIVEHRSTP